MVERVSVNHAGQDGRYWPRTTDPQLVDPFSTFAVCGDHGLCRDFRQAAYPLGSRIWPRLRLFFPNSFHEVTSQLSRRGSRLEPCLVVDIQTRLSHPGTTSPVRSAQRAMLPGRTPKESRRSRRMTCGAHARLAARGRRSGSECCGRPAARRRTRDVDGLRRARRVVAV